MRAAVAIAVLGLVILQAPIEALADPGSAKHVSAPGWEFDLGPYVWFPESTGTVTVGGVKTPVDMGYNDVAHMAGNFQALGGMGRFEARYGPYSLALDAMGGSLSTTEVQRLTPIPVPKVRTEANGAMAIVEVAAAYRLIEWGFSPLAARPAVEVTVGGRYHHLDEGSDVTLGKAHAIMSESEDWADPFIGGRYSVTLFDDLLVEFKGDAGGFGIGSDLSWSFVGALRYRLPFTLAGGTPWLIGGYKMLEFDHDGGSGNTDQLMLKGPMLGLGVRF